MDFGSISIDESSHLSHRKPVGISGKPIIQKVHFTVSKNNNFSHNPLNETWIQCVLQRMSQIELNVAKTWLIWITSNNFTTIDTPSQIVTNYFWHVYSDFNYCEEISIFWCCEMHCFMFNRICISLYPEVVPVCTPKHILRIISYYFWSLT